MPNANETQVGGSHYKGTAMEHWDMAIQTGLPYMEGQISKYLSRHSRKAGRQDVEKAAHFLEKLIESAKQGYVLPRQGAGHDTVNIFLAQNSHLGTYESDAIRLACCWDGTRDLERALYLTRRILDLSYPQAEA